MPATDTFLTIAEAAAQVRVSKMTIHRLIDRGELRALRVGRAWRISQASWDAYLERCAG